MTEQSPKENLMDGAEWADHEDCIIGDEKGLKNLISACEAALEKGEYYGSDLGNYSGVKLIETEWFKKPTHTGSSIPAIIFLVVVAGLLLVGIYTVVMWLT